MLNIIMVIVPYGSGDFIAKAARDAGAGGGTITMARGTAKSKLAQLLGLGDTSKDIVHIIIDQKKKDEIIETIKSASKKKKSPFGVLITTNVLYFTHSNKDVMEDNDMENTHQLITVIANKGYSDDIMAAARNAGAGGGTIMTARGTAQPNDKKFLNMEIVPEKEMLYIITEKTNAQKIIDGINSLKCLSKPGSGIVFSVPANDFTLLGSSNKK